MEYLQRILGLQTEYQEEVQTHLPNYIRSRYIIWNVMMDGVPAAYVYPRNELDDIRTLEKHLSRIRSVVDRPLVIILEHMTYRQREYLLRDRIPFIVKDRQIYLPFMAVYLQERCDAQTIAQSELLPSAQLLLLYYIYQGTGELVMSSAVRALGMTSTSISRAARQLESVALIRIRREGVQRIIYSQETPQEMYERAQEYLKSPVKRTMYLPARLVDGTLLTSADTALAEYSLLNESEIRTYAAVSISRWKDNLEDHIGDPQEQVAVELWRYDPRVLSRRHCVDPLSLALSLRDETDERIESAVEEMLQTVWEDIDGKRNREL